jgi:hypothetical protein
VARGMSLSHKPSHLVETGRSIQGGFDVEELGRAVRDVVAKQGLQTNALLKDECTTACKVDVAQLLASQRGGRDDELCNTSGGALMGASLTSQVPCNRVQATGGGYC